MKKVLPCVLLIAVLMCACGETADFSLVPGTVQEAAQPSPAAVPVPESTPEKVEIFDVFYDAGYYSDNVGNEWQYTLRIPGIRASGTDVAALNERMYSDLIPSVQDAQEGYRLCKEAAACLEGQLAQLREQMKRKQLH